MTARGRGQTTPWVLLTRPRPEARLRLFCFPYAGAAASAYHGWSAEFPSEIEVCPVQLPGRGGRFREPPIRQAQELLSAAADGLRPLLDRPFAFFGHSMGALLAFELAREFRRRGWPGPMLLAPSGHQAPPRPDPEPPCAHLPDAEFLEEVQRRYDGIPAEVLADEELLNLILPSLRADMLLIETYRYTAEPPLDCALSCFGGEHDRHVSGEDLEAWREQTTGSFKLRTLPGGHFFIDKQRGAVVGALCEDLRSLAEGSPEARA